MQLLLAHLCSAQVEYNSGRNVRRQHRVCVRSALCSEQLLVLSPTIEHRTGRPCAGLMQPRRGNAKLENELLLGFEAVALAALLDVAGDSVPYGCTLER